MTGESQSLCCYIAGFAGFAWGFIFLNMGYVRLSRLVSDSSNSWPYLLIESGKTLKTLAIHQILILTCHPALQLSFLFYFLVVNVGPSVSLWGRYYFLYVVCGIHLPFLILAIFMNPFFFFFLNVTVTHLFICDGCTSVGNNGFQMYSLLELQTCKCHVVFYCVLAWLQDMSLCHLSTSLLLSLIILLRNCSDCSATKITSTAWPLCRFCSYRIIIIRCGY